MRNLIMFLLFCATSGTSLTLAASLPKVNEIPVLVIMYMLLVGLVIISVHIAIAHFTKKKTVRAREEQKAEAMSMGRR